MNRDDRRAARDARHAARDARHAERDAKRAERGGNINTGTRYGGQTVTNVRYDGDYHAGDYHAGNYAEHVHGDQTSN